MLGLHLNQQLKILYKSGQGRPDYDSVDQI